MCIVDGSLKFLSPAGRHVYSSASASGMSAIGLFALQRSAMCIVVLKPQRGDMCIMPRRHRPNPKRILAV